MYTARFSEMFCPLASMHADSFAAGEHNSGYVALNNYHRAVILIDVGDLAATATLDVDLEQATSTAGAGAKAITGKSITQLTQAGGDSDDLVCMELRTEELDVDGGFDCINVEVTVANAAAEFSVWIFGYEPRFPPVPVTGWTEVVG